VAHVKYVYITTVYTTFALGNEYNIHFFPQVALTRATKASILKNDEKIQQMLSGMTLSGQS